MKKLFMLSMLLAFSGPLWAYTYTSGGSSSPTTITKISGGASGYSFIYLDSAPSQCTLYSGMYLGDLTTTVSNAQAARLLAIAMSAYLNHKDIIVSYQYTTDSTDANGDTRPDVESYQCFADNITIQDQ